MSENDDAQARLERNPEVIAAIQRAEKALRDGEAVDIVIPDHLDVRSPEALRLAVAVIADVTAPDPQPDHIELMGWLTNIADRLESEEKE